MKLRPFATCLAFAFLAPILLADISKPILLWPARVPDETKSLPPEQDQTKPSDELVAGRAVLRLGNISTPTITIYSPPKEKRNGAAIVVCPGGGYRILAMDLEGTEVCAWLNSIGVTAVLLKYRVPAREGLPRHVPALEDAQRALGLVRHQATELGIDPRRVGILGFSAGAHLAATLSTHTNERTYAPVDTNDANDCVPNFCVLLYPGGIVAKDGDPQIVPDIQVFAETPPTFLAMAEDDPVNVDNALYYYIALKKAKVPAEMHLYPKGRHGYGLRRTENTVTTWPDRVADWLNASGFLKPAS